MQRNVRRTRTRLCEQIAPWLTPAAPRRGPAARDHVIPGTDRGTGRRHSTDCEVGRGGASAYARRCTQPPIAAGWPPPRTAHRHHQHVEGPGITAKGEQRLRATPPQGRARESPQGRHRYNGMCGALQRAQPSATATGMGTSWITIGGASGWLPLEQGLNGASMTTPLAVVAVDVLGTLCSSCWGMADIRGKTAPQPR